MHVTRSNLRGGLRSGKRFVVNRADMRCTSPVRATSTVKVTSGRRAARFDARSPAAGLIGRSCGHRRRMARVRVGCSGWVYPDWKDLVYDGSPQREWLDRYATTFDTVEVNATFYRLPTITVVERWRTLAPAGFVFSPKLGQYCTHRKRLKDPGQWLGNHLDRVHRLGPHLGPNLVQLPPRWGRDVARLDAFLASAPRDIAWAIEFRDRSWLHDDVFDCLARHGAALCIHDLLEDHPWVLTTDWTYVRFHGPDAVNDPYHGRYGPRRLAGASDQLMSWCSSGIDVWAYFNNDWDANAWHDALWLREQTAVADVR